MTGPWIKLAVSVGVIATFLWWTDAGRVAEHLLSLNPLWIGVSILAATGATLSMAYRWQLTARALDIRFDYTFALREYYIAQLVNLILPGGVPGDIARTVRTRRKGDLKRAAQSVVAERILGQIALVSFLFIGFSVSLGVQTVLADPLLSWTVVLAFPCGALVVLTLSRSPSAFGRFTFFLLRLQKQTAFLVLGVTTSTCLILSFYAATRAIGITIPVEAVLIVIPLVLSAMLIPLSVGGWGWREGAAAALFPLIGASPSAGVASGITYGAVILVAALPAAVILLWPKTTETHSTKPKASSL